MPHSSPPFPLPPRTRLQLQPPLPLRRMLLLPIPAPPPLQVQLCRPEATSPPPTRPRFSLPKLEGGSNPCAQPQCTDSGGSCSSTRSSGTSNVVAHECKPH